MHLSRYLTNLQMLEQRANRAGRLITGARDVASNPPSDTLKPSTETLQPQTDTGSGSRSAADSADPPVPQTFH